jgi:hypothetical protein
MSKLTHTLARSPELAPLVAILSIALTGTVAFMTHKLNETRPLDRVHRQVSHMTTYQFANSQSIAHSKCPFEGSK